MDRVGHKDGIAFRHPPGRILVFHLLRGDMPQRCRIATQLAQVRPAQAYRTLTVSPGYGDLHACIYII